MTGTHRAMSPTARTCNWRRTAAARRRRSTATCAPRPRAAGTSARAGSPTRSTRATIDTTQIVPIDLNSLLYGLENAIRAAAPGAAIRPARASLRGMRRRAGDRGRPLSLECRCARVPRLSLDVTASRSHACRLPRCIRCSSRLASPAQAADIALDTIRRSAESRRHRDDTAADRRAVGRAQRLGADAMDRGVRTAPIRPGRTCRAPSRVAGWSTSQGVYQQSGKLVEKYDVMTPGRSGGGGEYPTQDGFGWTNGVMRRLLVLYPAGHCPQP